MCMHLSMLGRMTQQRTSDKIKFCALQLQTLSPSLKQCRLQTNHKRKDSVCLFPFLRQTALLVAPLLIFPDFQQMQTNIRMGRMPSVTANLLKSDLWFILVEELSPEIYLSVPFINWRCAYERCTYVKDCLSGL